MWSWREWRRERQMRKQLGETLKTKKRQRFGSSSTGATTGSGAAGDGPAAAIAQTPSVALLVQVGQQLDRRAPITLSIVVTALLGGSSPFMLMNDTTFLHEVISFAWTGYYLEKKLGGLRFLLVLAYLLVLSQVLLTVTAFVMAKTILYSGSLMQWTVGFSSVLWALKVVMTRQYPTLAPGLDIKVPTNYLTWIELLGVHIFLPRLTLLSQISGLAAGYLFTVIPGTMKLLAKYELQVDRALRKQGIKLPVKHRWKLVISDFGHSIKAIKWWPRFRKCKATGA